MRLAISTCPNDTFAFHAILHRKIDLRGLEFDIELLDIQQLNEGLLTGQFDISKASFYAAIRSAETTFVLPSGSALGFGVGPLLLASASQTSPDRQLPGGSSITLCPGSLTTAALLFELFYATAIAEGKTTVQHCIFSDIMPALKNSCADFGVCIHEGRFTWPDEGLFLVADLGTRWEQDTNSPLPLGGIVARRDLDRNQLWTAQAVIRDSIEYAFAHRDETVPTMRHYAQSLIDEVLLQHVDLYVNDWTIDLGDVGRRALDRLTDKAIECGLIDSRGRRLEILTR